MLSATRPGCALRGLPAGAASPSLVRVCLIIAGLRKLKSISVRSSHARLVRHFLALTVRVATLQAVDKRAHAK